MQFNLAHEDRRMVEWRHVLMQRSLSGIRLQADSTTKLYHSNSTCLYNCGAPQR